MTATTRTIFAFRPTDHFASRLWIGQATSLQDAFDQVRRAGVSLRGVDLNGTLLSGLNLSGLDLEEANFTGATCQGTDFTGSTLTRATFRRADLTGAVLSGCDLSTTSFAEDTRLDRALLNTVQGVPVVEDLHRRVYEAARQAGALDMSDWHTCETTHCRAGWVTHLAGPAGRALEDSIGTAPAARLIYLVSDPERFSGAGAEPLPAFFFTSEPSALQDMARMAGVGARRGG